MKAVARFPFLIFAGLLVLQAAWIVTVPPFRAIDEFDHVFRAAGVAEGDWRPTRDTVEGRGLLVTVPDDVVQAAQAQCDRLPYPGPDNCFPVERLDGGLVVVSSAAAAYNPAYYFVLGEVGRWFEGANVDFAMRAVSALLSALGAAVAALCLSLANAGRWTRFGFVAAFSPILVYTTVIPAPNGVEIVAGLCLWSSLWALLTGPPSPRRDWFNVGVATVAATVMSTVRYLGPMWLGLIVLSVMLCAGWPALVNAVRRAWRPLLIAVVIVLGALALSVWWILSAELTGPTEDRAEYEGPVSRDLGTQPVVWVLQMIAAFPLRGDVAPSEVYALYLLPISAFVVAAARKATGRDRVMILALTGFVLAFPVVLSLLTAESHGIIWQGRYQLCFAVGLLIFSGVALDKAGAAPREGPKLALVALLMFGLAHWRSVVGLLFDEKKHPVSSVDPAWLAPNPYVLSGLVLVGFSLWVLALRPRPERIGNERIDA